jgi:hypothetical protein
MAWAGWLCIVFQNIRKRFRGNLFKFVFLLLSVPCFQINNFFQASVPDPTAQTDCCLPKVPHLGGEDYSIEFDDLRLGHGSIAEAHDCLHDFTSGLEPRGYSGNGAYINRHS